MLRDKKKVPTDDSMKSLGEPKPFALGSSPRNLLVTQLSQNSRNLANSS